MTTTQPGLMPLRHGGDGIFLAVEYPRRSAMPRRRMLGDLHHRAFGDEVSAEDHQAALGSERLFER
jgi:hypothetical protein